MSHRHPESVHIHCVRWHQTASQQDVCCSVYQNFPLLSCCPIPSRNWMHQTGTARLIGQDNQHDARNSVKTNNEEENLRQDRENGPRYPGMARKAPPRRRPSPRTAHFLLSPSIRVGRDRRSARGSLIPATRIHSIPSATNREADTGAVRTLGRGGEQGLPATPPDPAPGSVERRKDIRIGTKIAIRIHCGNRIGVQ